MTVKRARAASETRHRWLALLLVVAGLAAFANIFSSPFVFDDDEAIVTNVSIRQFETALAPPAQSPVAGRPVVNLSFAINYALGGLSPTGYRVTNLAIHLMAGLLLFGLIRRTLAAARPPGLASRFAGSADWLAFLCALIWLVHPLQTEVIGYVTERSESMAGLFLLLTLYAALRGMTDRANHVRWYVVAVVASVLGMATKETVVVAPILVLLYDRVFESGSFSAALKARGALYASLAATWIVLIVLELPGPRANTAGWSAGVSSWTYLVNQAGMIVRYLSLTFWPHGLVLDYGVPHALSFTSALPAIAIVLALLAATAVAWPRWPGLAFLGAWFFITLAPSSSIVPIASEVGAERRMYLPLAAIIVGVVILAASLMGRWRSKGRWGGIAVAALVALGLGALTIQRNTEYHSRLGLWQTVLDRYPHGRAHFNMGAELAAQGRHDDAIREYREGTKDPNDSFESELGLGFELHTRGNEAEAVQHLQAFIREKPNAPDTGAAYNAEARALFALGRIDEAVVAFRHVLQINPGNADVRSRLAETLLRQGKFDDAIAEYRELLARAPSDSPQVALSHYNLGTALSFEGKSEDAVKEFREAVRIDPNYAAAHSNLAANLHALGKLDEASVEYRRAIALDPNNVEAHNNLGRLLAGTGHAQLAVDEYRQALARRPDWPVAIAGLAWVRATSADPHVRDATEAVRLAERAVDLTRGADASALDTLGAAYAAAGRFDKATAEVDAALRQNPAAATVQDVRAHRELYARHQALFFR